MKKIFRIIYNLIPFKQGIFKLLKPLNLSDNITRHLVFKGVMTLGVGNGKKIKLINRGFFLEQLFFWKGVDGWERMSNHLWCALSAQSEVIFDVGANTGIYAILSKIFNYKSQVHAFEPVKKVFEDMKMNIELNNLDNVYLYNEAVSNHIGEFELYDMKDGVFYEASLEKKYIDNLTYDKDRYIKYMVKVDTIKGIVERTGLKRIDLMKIDVETHEPSVIEGMGVYLKEFKPILIIEILNQEVAEKLKPYFDDANYLFYNINEQTGYQKVDALIPSSHFNFIICPKEKENILNLAFATVNRN